MRRLISALTVSLVFFTLNLALPSGAFAHGESDVGPHDGFIQMPGAFHTELVVSKEFAKVYLLDIQFKNPTVNNSKVEVSYISLAGKKIPLKCAQLNDHYECPIPKDADPTKGQVEIKPTRSNETGNAVIYKLPLKR